MIHKLENAMNFCKSNVFQFIIMKAIRCFVYLLAHRLKKLCVCVWYSALIIRSVHAITEAHMNLVETWDRENKNKNRDRNFRDVYVCLVYH